MPTRTFALRRNSVYKRMGAHGPRDGETECRHLENVERSHCLAFVSDVHIGPVTAGAEWAPSALDLPERRAKRLARALDVILVAILVVCSSVRRSSFRDPQPARTTRTTIKITAKMVHRQLPARAARETTLAAEHAYLCRQYTS